MSARQPLFWVAFFFAWGICAGGYLWRPATWWIAAILVFVFSATHLSRRRLVPSRALILAASFIAGSLSIQLHDASSARDAQVWLAENEALITADVITEGDIQSDGPGSFRQRIDVETEQIESATQSTPVRVGVRLSIFQTDRTAHPTPMQLFCYGQRIRFRATLAAPRNYRNPGAFDYAGYLREDGISATASTKYANVEVLHGFVGNRFELMRSRIHRSIITRIHALWPARIADLMDAVVIGEETFIERSTRADFQRSGTYHILVVSGMNVSILAMFALWGLRRLGFSDVVASICAIALILLYAVLTRQGSPVWRAALMFAVYLCTRLLYRDRAMLNALAVAALILLIADPNALFSASFQMTFLCVALVAAIGVPVLDRTIHPYAQGLRYLNALAYDRSLPPKIAQFRLDIRMISGHLGMILPGRISRSLMITSLRAAFSLAELVVLSTILQLGLALPMAYYFHRATSLAMPANLFVIPFLELLMPAAVLAISVSYVSLTLAKLPALIAGLALQNIAGTVKWLGGMRLADIRVPTPSLPAILFCGLAILICAFWVRKRAMLAVLGICALTASAFWVWIITPPQQCRQNVLEMTAIDVGQGDSVFLVTPEGRKLLVDAGGLPFWMHSQLDIGEDVVSPYLWTRGFSRLDAIVLTHAHADHMGGMFAVISNFRPRELWLPSGIPEPEIYRLLEEAHRFGLEVKYRAAGEVFNYGGATMRVLAPTQGSTERNSHRNDESLILKVTYGKTSVLLEADAEKPTEEFIATENPSADVLKVAHHGSASSTSDKLLAAVHPRFAVISVGYRNVYHHPRQEVLERLQDSRVITYRTDSHGATSFFLDGTRVTSQSAANR